MRCICGHLKSKHKLQTGFFGDTYGCTVPDCKCYGFVSQPVTGYSRLPGLDRDDCKEMMALAHHFDKMVKGMVGLEVVWREGKYAGRRARVKYASWDFESRFYKSVEIMVIVETMRWDEKGYLSSSDDFHRLYRNLHEHFEDYRCKTLG